MEATAPAAPELGAAAPVAFVLYLVAVVAIGALATRFSSSGLSEFFIGGRRMNRYVVALSAVVSGRSAWLLLGVTGLAYTRGASAVWAVVGYVVAELFLFLFYGRRLRRFSDAYDCVTVPDFFAARFADRSGVLRLSLVAVMFFFLVIYVGAQFLAGGKAFAAGFGLDPDTGVLITTGIVLLYTILGGFLAVSLTDAMQGVLMLVSLVVLPAVAIVGAGGLEAVLRELQVLGPTLVDPLALGLGAFTGFLGIGLGSAGNPHILARYMSIAEPDQLRTAAVVGTVWNVLMGWGAVFTGLAARVSLGGRFLAPGADPEAVFPELARGLLPELLFGLVVASVFAAIMSTADSQLLVAASGVVRDVYEQVLARGREVPQRRLVLLSRLAVLVLVALALGIGVAAQEKVFWLVLVSWSGLGAALGPTSILALYWRRTTRAGVLAGLFTGTAVTVVWERTPALNDALYELVPAFVASLAATLVVSLLTRPPEDCEAMFAAMGEGEGR